MGRGEIYKCSKCGNEYSVYFGTGFSFDSVYGETMEDVASGKYGEERKELLEKVKYIAVDSESDVYICGNCGFWKQEQGLGLYKPKNPEKIAKEKFGDKTVEELGYVPYVMRYKLLEDYRLVKTYVHRCDKCGRRMRRATEEDLGRLPCPVCGTENLMTRQILWD